MGGTMQGPAPDVTQMAVGRVPLAAGERGGDTFVATAGLHGNEPGGVAALERVARVFRERGLQPAGRVLFAVGNLGALARDVRFLERDLNRCFDSETLAAVAAGRAATAEERELAELLAAIEPEVAEARGPVTFFDLHSASAEGPPFALFGDTLANRAVARWLPAPKILGLEETVEGSLLSWFGERGHVAIGVEGGQHTGPETVDHLEAVLWLGLVGAGQLAPEALPELERHRAVLTAACAGVPSFVAVRRRHHVEPCDEFRMEPGFRNFDAVRRGQLLARDASGEVRAEFTGRVLLPLYQGQGQDGFFLGADIPERWLKLSARLRGPRAAAWLRRIPGVRSVPGAPDELHVDRRIARLRALDVMHLFGYRRVGEDGRWLRVRRRREGPGPE